MVTRQGNSYFRLSLSSKELPKGLTSHTAIVSYKPAIAYHKYS